MSPDDTRPALPNRRRALNQHLVWHLALTTLVLDELTCATRCLYGTPRFVLRCLPPQLRVRHRATLLGDEDAQPRQPLVQLCRVRVFLWRGHDVEVAYLA
jgi:hypothetical protein